MVFRLPRLPETDEIVETNRRPTFKLQRWWQSVVTKIETQETTQDQMLIDIQTALTNAGIALDLAGALMPDIAPVTIQADYTGAVLDGQLPRNIAATRFAGDTNVTTSSAWSASTVSGGATYTIGAATGILNVTAITATTVIEVTSVYDSISRSRKVTVYKALQDPPPSSGSSTQYDTSIDPTTSASYGSANAGILTITCGASGNVDLAAPLDFVASTVGSFDALGKWQYSASGAGVWNDVDTELASSLPTSGAGTVAGYLEVNQTQTGLTPASDYDFQLLLRNDSGTHTQYYVGTASASTS